VCQECRRRAGVEARPKLKGSELVVDMEDADAGGERRR
jgi:hypothetical protein